MNRKTLIVLISTTIMMVIVACGGPKKAGYQKLDREILGEELAFGRDAAAAGLWNEAIFRWEKVLQEQPDNAKATNNLAVAYETVGNFDKAEALYKRALELNESSPDIRKNYKRFLSFYKKHKRQLAREKRARDASDADADEDVIDEEDEEGL